MQDSREIHVIPHPDVPGMAFSVLEAAGII
jgi:hypothetical protein